MPTVTEQLSILTQSVDTLTAAVNEKKQTLDQAVLEASEFVNQSKGFSELAELHANTTLSYVSAVENYSNSAANSAIQSAIYAERAGISASQLQVAVSFFDEYDAETIFVTWEEYQSLVASNNINPNVFYAVTT